MTEREFIEACLTNFEAIRQYRKIRSGIGQSLALEDMEQIAKTGIEVIEKYYTQRQREGLIWTTTDSAR